jgi:hypothetical protein
MISVYSFRRLELGPRLAIVAMRTVIRTGIERANVIKAMAQINRFS